MSDALDLTGKATESWYCVDCGVNTAPGVPSRIDMERAFRSQTAAGALLLAAEPSVPQEINDRSEIYTVRASVWEAAGMEPMGGCLCIGCIESISPRSCAANMLRTLAARISRYRKRWQSSVHLSRWNGRRRNSACWPLNPWRISPRVCLRPSVLAPSPVLSVQVCA